MKTFLLIVMLPLFFSTGEVRKTEDSVAQATLIVYRKGQFNAALQNFNVFVNGERACKISNKRYFEYKVNPGAVFLASKAGGIEVFKKKEKFEIEVEADQTYYIACEVKSSLMRNRLEFSEVTKRTADKILPNLEMDNCMTED